MMILYMILIFGSFCEIAGAGATVNINLLPTSSPQPTRIGYKYDFEMWFTTTDIGAYTSMVLVLDVPSETNPIPIKNRFCRQITLSVNGSINKPSSTPYYESADLITDLASHVGTFLGSFSVAGPASMRFTFSLVPAVTMSAPGNYTFKYLVQYSLNGSKTLTVISATYALNFGGPEDVSALEDKSVPFNFAGPSTMKLNETNYFSFNISLDRISPTVVMKAMWYHPTLKHGISVLNMMLVQFGPFWTCCMFTPSFKHFPPIFDPNEGEVGNKGLKLIMYTFSNTGARDNNATNWQNFLYFTISVHVYGYDKTIVGNTFTIYAAAIVDGVTLLNASINFTVAGAVVPANLSSLPTVSSSAVSWSAAVGGVAAALLSIQLPRSVSTDYSLIVMTNTSQSYMTSYYLQQGAHIYNIPYVAEYPQLTNMQFYYQNGLYCIRMPLGIIANTQEATPGWAYASDVMSYKIWIGIRQNATSLIGQTISATMVLSYYGESTNVSANQVWTITSQNGVMTYTPSLYAFFYNNTNGSIGASNAQKVAVYLQGTYAYTTYSTALGPSIFYSVSNTVPSGYSVCELKIIQSDQNLPGLRKYLLNGDASTIYNSSGAFLDIGNDTYIAMFVWPVNPTPLIFTARAVLVPTPGLTVGRYGVYFNATVKNTVFYTPLYINYSATSASLYPQGVTISAYMRSFVMNNIYNGETGILVIRSIFSPYQSGHYVLTVQLSNELQFCSVKVFAGNNFPCHGFGSSILPVIQGQTLIYDFGIVTNVGSPESQPDDDIISIMVAIVAQSVNVPVLATVQIADNLGNSKSLSIQENVQLYNAQSSQPTVLYFGPVFENTSLVMPGIVYHYKIQVLMPRFSSQIMNISVMPPQKVTGDSIRIIGAYLTSVKENVPCVSSYTIPEYKSINGSNFFNTFSFSMLVCQAEMALYYSSDYLQNTFVVEFAFTLLPSSSLAAVDKTIFEITAVINSLSYKINLTVTLSAPVFLNLMSNLSLLTTNSDDANLTDQLIPGSYGSKTFNVTIPSNSTGFAVFAVHSSFGNGTTGLHINNLAMTYVGRNIQCVKDNETLKEYNSTLIIPVSYKDSATQKMWMNNMGYTYRTRDGPMPGDDSLVFEVEYLMTDNNMAVAAYEWVLFFTFSYSNILLSVNHTVSTKRFGNEAPNLNFTTSFGSADNSTDFRPADNISLDIILSHGLGSSAEIINVSATIYSPQTLVILPMQAQPINVFLKVVTYPFGFQMTYPRLLFLDAVTSTVDFQLKDMSMETSSLTVMIPYQLEYFIIDRSVNTLQFIRKITPLKELMLQLNINGTECDDELTQNLQSCQILTSSNYVNSSSLNVKYSSTYFWSPEVRQGATEYVEFAFNQIAKIQRLEFYTDLQYLQPTRILISSSSDGIVWTNITLMHLTFTKSTQKATAIFDSMMLLTTQFLRISFPEDAAISTGQSYYGLRIGVFGCLITNSTATSTCLTLDPKDVWGERHFLEIANGTVSVCLYNPKKSRRQCFVSPDAETWTLLPESSAYLIGFDSNNLLSCDASRTEATVSMDQGQTWTVIPYNIVGNALKSQSFRSAIAVPYISSDASIFSSGVLSSGKWIGKFDGIYGDKVDVRGVTQQQKFNWIFF